MNKLSLSLVVAGVMAVAGVAQAETFDSPMRAGEASTMTMGQPNQLTTNSPYGDGNTVVETTIIGATPVTIVDTTMLGAGPAIVTTPGYVYVQPSTHWTQSGYTVYSWSPSGYMSPGAPYYGN